MAFYDTYGDSKRAAQQNTLARDAQTIQGFQAFADFLQKNQANKMTNQTNQDTNAIAAFRAGLRPMPPQQQMIQQGRPGINMMGSTPLNPQQLAYQNKMNGIMSQNGALEPVAIIGGKQMYADPNASGQAVYSFNPVTGALEQVANVSKGSIVRNQLSLSDIAAKEDAKYGANKQVADRAFTLRNEFNQLPTVKEYQTIKSQVSGMDNLLKSANKGEMKSALALDQGLITLFNKITDPISVVRESEYERTPRNLSLANRFSGAIEKLSNGGAGLTNEDRESLVFGAKVIADSRGQQYNEVYNAFINDAKDFGIDKPSMVVGSYKEHKPFISRDSSGNKKDNSSEDTLLDFNSARQAVLGS